MDGIPCKEKHPVVAFLDSMVSSFAIKWWNTFYNFDVDKKKKKSQNMRFENKKQQKHQSQSSHWQKSNHFIVALTVI